MTVFTAWGANNRPLIGIYNHGQEEYLVIKKCMRAMLHFPGKGECLARALAPLKCLAALVPLYTMLVSCVLIGLQKRSISKQKVGCVRE